MGETKIEWTDKVWNPVTGCTKVSAGCKNCYAERIFHRPYPGRDFGDVRCHPKRLDQPLRWRKPCRIFVNSMSDLFHERIPDNFIDELFAVMAICQHHIFQVLTKRPARALEYSRPIGGTLRSDWVWSRIAHRLNVSRCKYPIWPLQNVWLGVSVEDQATADERIPLLLQTPAAVRFVSYEPALGPVDFREYIEGPELGRALIHHQRTGHDCGSGYCDQCPATWHESVTPRWALDWLIVGGESGPKARPSHPDWFRSVRDQCQAAGVPFFFKQWGEWRDGSDSKGHDLCVYPDGRRCAFTQEAISEREARSGKKHNESRAVLMSKAGKKRAGRLLDGREWNEFPQLEGDRR